MKELLALIDRLMGRVYTPDQQELGEFPLGANKDTRTDEQRNVEDISFDEVVASAAPVFYEEIDPEKIRVFGVQNQGSKSDCVAESRRKIKRILFKVNKGTDIDFSSVAFYRKRSNYPKEGMIASDAVALDQNTGMTLDLLVPSDAVKTEGAANSLKPDAYNDDVSKIFSVQGGEVIFTPGNMDTVSGTIQKTRKGVMMWFFFTQREWARNVPIILDNLTGPYESRSLRHSVVGIEPAKYNGVEGIWIDDSAPFGGFSRRFITREFYEKRNWYASYPIAFKFEPMTSYRPSYDESVKSLQECLKYEGTFPSNTDVTGVIGPITISAVKSFQSKYGLEPVGTAGPQTRAKLHLLFP